MLSYTDLQKGIIFVLDDEPYEVLEYQFLRMQQRKPVVQAKVKNLLSGKIVSRSFHQNESFQEAEIEKQKMKFIFAHRGSFTFSDPKNLQNRLVLEEKAVGDGAKFLKANLEVELRKFGEKIIGLILPIKIDYLVKNAPPAERGNTVQGGSKEVELENGMRLQTPLFINEGDIIRVNSQTGEYVERAEKNR